MFLLPPENVPLWSSPQTQGKLQSESFGEKNQAFCGGVQGQKQIWELKDTLENELGDELGEYEFEII